MCGVIGGFLNKPIFSFLLDKLKKLEYRGYDSFGLATFHENQTLIEKKLGAPSQYSLKNFNEKHRGHIGLGHTRWATHGAVSVKNAHPHQIIFEKWQLTLVHNGIVENIPFIDKTIDKEIKSLIQSETDSELIIAHLMSSLKEGFTIEQALKNLSINLKGQFAFILHYQDDKETHIIGMRRTLPLYLQNDPRQNTYLFCSDRQGFHTDKNCFLLFEDKPFFLKQDSTDGLKKITFEEIFKRHSAEKRIFNSMMEKEIYEQPAIIKYHFNELDKENYHDELKSKTWKSIHLIGCGTSYHAGLIGKYWFEKICYIPTQTFIASEYRYNPPLLEKKGSLAILISQSGETADLLSLVDMALEAYELVITICNNRNSTLVAKVKASMALHAGTEIGVASTKAYCAQILCLLKLVRFIDPHKNIEPISFKKSMLKLSEAAKQVLHLPHYNKIAKYLSNYKHLLILGRGPLLSVALEGALKIKEISYIHAQAVPTGELKHGTLALIDLNCPVILMINNDHYYEKNLLSCRELLARQAQLIIITTVKKPLPFEKELQWVIRIPESNLLFESLIFTFPLQILALKIAEALKKDVDKPRNLAKSVTVE